jgi:hypothetical protein
MAWLTDITPRRVGYVVDGDHIHAGLQTEQCGWPGFTTISSANTIRSLEVAR